MAEGIFVSLMMQYILENCKKYTFVDDQYSVINMSLCKKQRKLFTMRIFESYEKYILLIVNILFDYSPSSGENL